MKANLAIFGGTLILETLVLALVLPLCARMGYEGLAKLSGVLLVAYPCFFLVGGLGLAFLQDVFPRCKVYLGILTGFFLGCVLALFFCTFVCPCEAVRIDYAAPCAGIVKEKHNQDADWRLWWATCLSTTRYVILEDASGRRFKKHIDGVVWRVIKVGDHIEKKEGARQPLQVNGEVPAIPAKTWAAEILDGLLNAMMPN